MRFPRLAIWSVATCTAVGALTAPSAVAAGTAATSTSFAVYTGYADCPDATGCDATTVSNADFPNPWYGSKNVTFEGDTTIANPMTDEDPDESAIRVDNRGHAALTINDVSFSCGGSAIDLWGTAPFAYPYTVAAGQKIIFSGTASGNMDGSDICTTSATVTVVIDGVSHSYADDIANGGRGAIWGAPVSAGIDESTPWAKIHGPKTTISVRPASLPRATVGAAYSEKIAAQASNGDPTFSVISGSLPPGLTLTPDSVYHSAADLAGTPTTAGTYTFTVGVTDTASPADAGSRTYKFVVS